MPELPDSARKLIHLERSASGPSQETRERVRKGVALALAASVGTATSSAKAATLSRSAGAAKLGPLLSPAGKLWLVAGAVAVIGGANLAVRTLPKPSLPPSASAKAVLPMVSTSVPNEPLAPPPPDAPVPLEPVHAEAVVPRAVPPLQGPKSSRSSVVTHGDLRAETLLLAAASSALEHGDVAEAQARLTQYRTQFTRGQLQQEYQGLELLARCMANEPEAPKRAQQYLKGLKSGVLAARIEATCKPKLQP